MTHTAGPELDALIAEKVMGWSSFAKYGSGTADDFPFIEWAEQNGGGWLFWRDTGSDGVPWSPSTDIKTAWKVLEKFNCVELMTVGSQWKCAFFFSTASSGAKQTTDYVYAETAPLAICLAALKAVE